jgi:hypothetical protein
MVDGKLNISYKAKTKQVNNIFRQIGPQIVTQQNNEIYTVDNEYFFLKMNKPKTKQDIYDFLVKNRDLDSNLDNM